MKDDGAMDIAIKFGPRAPRARIALTEKIRAYGDKRAAEAASPAAGWELAPIEPSEVALKAAREAYVAEMETRPVPEAFQPHNVLLAFRAAYRAVIEASPAPSEEARAG